MARPPSFATAVFGLGLLACASPGLPPVGSAAAPLAPAQARPGPRFVSPYAYEWFVRAELARATGDPAAALQGYERVLAGDTEDPYVLARMAEAQVELGALEEAEASLALALRLDPACERAWLARGALAERRGRPDEALALYQAAARVAPWSEAPLLALSRLLLAQGHPERSRALWRELGSAATPARSAGHLQLELERALTAGDAEAIALSLTKLVRERGAAEESLHRGIGALLEAGRPELAVPLLDALPARPQHTALRLQVLLQAAELDRAEQLLASEPPDALGGAVIVAEAYLRIGQPARARERLEEAPNVPGDWRRQRLDGQLALELGECAEAARLLGAIPAASREFAAAVADLRHALRCAGLPALAEELSGI